MNHLKGVSVYQRFIQNLITDAKSCCPYEQCQQKVAKV